MSPTSSRSSSAHAPNSGESSLRLAVILCGIDICLNGYAAYGSNSVTILGALFRELADCIAMLSAFATVRAVRRAPNEHFAYGVGKRENLVSVGTALLMAGCGISILLQALEAMTHPRPTQGTLPGIMLFAGSALVGLWLWQRNQSALRHQLHVEVVERRRQHNGEEREVQPRDINAEVCRDERVGEECKMPVIEASNTL
jgi:divalent metal cation (Fe/Co/Zn/Cd) transporter